MPSFPFFRTGPFALAAALGAVGLSPATFAQEIPLAEAGSAADGAAPETPQRLFIREYRVRGARQLPRLAIERAVYRFLGPARTPDDVERARAALEQAYRTNGYQTVAVVVPRDQSPARVRAGVIELEVLEGTVGRLRVEGARFSSPRAVAAMVPSLQEGRVPNFQEVTRDFLALVPVAGREIAPDIRAGVRPGTIDVDLKVKERLPVRAGVEVNNRYSADTTKLRLNASFGLQNLWQAGHSLNLSYQTAPERREDSEVYSGYYLLPLGRGGASSLMLQASRQNSDVSTLGQIPVLGRGSSFGLRFMQTLPVPEAASRAAAGETGAADPARFHHSLSFGLDYKRNHQVVTLPSTATGSDGGAAAPTLEETATAHYPLSATYSLLWETGRWTTELNTGATLHVRGLGNGDTAFNDSRYRADGGYFYYRADFTETVRLRWDFQAQARLQGQVADRPLLPSEQISVGGLGTVRGYLEAEAAGDHGAFASFELRSPSLAPAGWGEWRLHGFLDWGWVGSKVPLDDETAQTRLLSIGGGTRWQFGRWFSGSLDVGKPVLDGPRTGNDEVRVTFRAGLDY